MISAGRGGGHVEIVAEDDALKAQLAAKDISDPAPRETGGAVVQAFEYDVGRHDARQIRSGETFEGHEVGQSEILVRAVIDGKHAV